MPNQWERQPRIPELLIVVVLIIIGCLLFSYFFKDISSQINPTALTSSINNINPSSINDPNALNSSISSSPLSPNANNTSNSGSGNNVFVFTFLDQNLVYILMLLRLLWSNAILCANIEVSAKTPQTKIIEHM